MKKRVIQQQTCFLLGLVGAGVGGLCGLLRALSLGPAEFLRLLSMVLYGAMLLFLAGTQKGDENRSRRQKLLGLFLALLVSYWELPLLCPPLEGIVVPLLALMYRAPEAPQRGRWWLLAACELAFVAARTALILPSLAAWQLPLGGAAMALVSAARFWVLWGLYSRARKQPSALRERNADRLKHPYAPTVSKQKGRAR